MPDLSFQVDDAQAEKCAAAPLLTFKLRITNENPSETIQNVALRCQIQIEATRRRYNAAEQERLSDLYGEPERWSKTLGSLLWTHTNAGIPPFTGETVVDLPVPCTFDFNVAATKYFHGLEDGEIPLILQFSGTIFYPSANRNLQIAQIPWNKECRYRLPVGVWQEMMDLYYPQSAWLRLRRDVFDRLAHYKAQQGATTWEETIAHLIEASGEQVSS